MALRESTVLYGMMGCGKSPLGLGLARHRGEEFVDADTLIEVQAGLTCKQIIDDPLLDFATIQEQTLLGFRPETPHVIATGGSVARYPVLVDHLGQFGIGIFIFVDPDELQSRLTPERIAALNNPNRLSFADLYMERVPFYEAAADLRLDVPAGELIDVTQARLNELRASVA